VDSACAPERRPETFEGSGVDLELSPDQEMFRDTTRRFLENEAPLSVVRSLEEDQAGFSRSYWSKGAGLGWTSMLVPEEFGGAGDYGQGLLDLVLVAEEMGRLTSPGPLVPTNVVAAALVAAGSDGQRQDVLPGIVSGDLVATWAIAEPHATWGPEGVNLTAEADGDGFVLNGRKTQVEAGAQADLVLVTARSGAGLTQFLVPSGTSGVEVVPHRSLDLTRRFAELRFDGARLPASAVVGVVGGAADEVERQTQVALVLQCAEAAGAAARVFDFTLEYAADRYSFGRPLASYQALKHRFADMKLWLEASHAIADGAAEGVHERSPKAAELARVAKAYVGDRTVELVQDCVQMHGGIGVTWEHDIHLYLRRVSVDKNTYGTPAEHREALATLIGL